MNGPETGSGGQDVPDLEILYSLLARYTSEHPEQDWVDFGSMLFTGTLTIAGKKEHPFQVGVSLDGKRVLLLLMDGKTSKCLLDVPASAFKHTMIEEALAVERFRSEKLTQRLIVLQETEKIQSATLLRVTKDNMALFEQIKSAMKESESLCKSVDQFRVMFYGLLAAVLAIAGGACVACVGQKVFPPAGEQPAQKQVDQKK